MKSFYFALILLNIYIKTATNKNLYQMYDGMTNNKYINLFNGNKFIKRNTL